MSKKGTTWSKHKYIRIENGRYIYKENSAKESKQIDAAVKSYNGTIQSLNPNLIKGMSRSAISGLAASLIARNKTLLKNFKLGKGKSSSSSSKSGSKGSGEKKSSEKKGSSKEKTEKESTSSKATETKEVVETPKYTVDTEYTKRLEEFVNKDRSKLPIIYEWAENELKKQKKLKHYDSETPYMVNGRIYTSTDEKPDLNSQIFPGRDF